MAYLIILSTMTFKIYHFPLLMTQILWTVHLHILSCCQWQQWHLAIYNRGGKIKVVDLWLWDSQSILTGAPSTLKRFLQFEIFKWKRQLKLKLMEFCITKNTSLTHRAGVLWHANCTSLHHINLIDLDKPVTTSFNWIQMISELQKLIGTFLSWVCIGAFHLQLKMNF